MGELLPLISYLIRVLFWLYTYIAKLLVFLAPQQTHAHTHTHTHTHTVTQNRLLTISYPPFCCLAPACYLRFLVTFALNLKEGYSCFVILDAADLSQGPLAVLKTPQHVPLGLHGTWVPSDALQKCDVSWA